MFVEMSTHLGKHVYYGKSNTMHSLRFYLFTSPLKQV